MIGRSVLYHLSHASSSFFALVLFQIGAQVFALGHHPPVHASCIARWEACTTTPNLFIEREFKQDMKM
jgi:hypothetical protein